MNEKNFPIGLDFSDYSVKFVQLKKKGEKIIVSSLGKVDLAKGLIENGDILKPKEIQEALKKLFEKPIYGPKPIFDEAIVSLPEGKTFIKVIEIDKSANKITDLIEPEMEKYIPYQIAELYYDWQIADENMQKYWVQIGAAPKTAVNAYIDLLKDLKITPVAFEIESQSISRSLLIEETPSYKKSPISNNYLIIDLGAKHSSLFAYAKNSILFDISLPLSGDQITDTVAKTLQLSEEQAEKAKIIVGLDKEKANGIIFTILSDRINNLIKKIEESLDYFTYHYPTYGKINKIILCGGGANIISLDTIISRALKIEVIKGDPLANLDKSSFAEITKSLTETHRMSITAGQVQNDLQVDQNTSLSYCPAIGLALRGIFSKIL